MKVTKRAEPFNDSLNAWLEVLGSDRFVTLMCDGVAARATKRSFHQSARSSLTHQLFVLTCSIIYTQFITTARASSALCSSQSAAMSRREERELQRDVAAPDLPQPARPLPPRSRSFAREVRQVPYAGCRSACGVHSA